jgi:hypothetical protein
MGAHTPFNSLANAINSSCRTVFSSELFLIVYVRTSGKYWTEGGGLRAEVSL